MKTNHIYINGLGIVSPLGLLSAGNFPSAPAQVTDNMLKCPDPGYREYIPADQIRRMGRIIRMGITAARVCLNDASVIAGRSSEVAEEPGAIITGTGLGCLEDTEKFLASMIRNKEEFLTPTSFIQSTHNTVAGQIALQLKCHSPNYTYVHRGHSFESALSDTLTHIRSGMAGKVLAGGCDELTQHSFTIQSRLGFWKKKPVQTENLYTDRQKGTVAGEGAAFMLLGNERFPGSYARLTALSMFRNPSGTEEITRRIGEFLERNGGIKPDAVMLGLNGDPQTDHIYKVVSQSLPEAAIRCCFKHLCGEYFTSGSFAVGLSALALKAQSIPSIIKVSAYTGNDTGNPDHGTLPAPIENILVYNHFMGQQHTLILLSRV